MATAVKTDLDFEGNQILNALFQPVGSDPSTPADGQLWYRTDTDRYMGRQNGVTVELATGTIQQKNLAATSAPGATDDSTAGYAVGSLWVNVTSDLAYICVDSTASSAIWVEITQSGGAGSTNLAWVAATSTISSSTGTNAILTVVDGSNPGLMIVADKTKLDGIETAADVTDAVNVNAAGAVMNSDATTAAMGMVIDDDTMAAATATVLSTAESIVAYIATQIAGFGRYQGGYNAATDTPSLDDGTPVAGIQAGDSYTVTVAGNFFTQAVEIGDLLIAETDGATLEAQWTIVNRNIDAASETVAGIVERATQAEVDAGADTTRYISPATLAATSLVNKFAVDCAGAATTTVTHNLATTDVQVQVRDTATGVHVIADVDVTGANAVDVTISPAPLAGDYRIIVVG